MKPKQNSRGFTLLELLIVIAIIAILSAILIFVLNPAETLRQTRDSQRLNDLKTLNNAIAFYITTVKNPVLDQSSAVNRCEDGTASGSPNGRIWLSGPQVQGSLSAGNEMGVNLDHPDPVPPPAGWMGGFFWWIQTGGWEAGPGTPPDRNIDSTGWLPVDFNSIPDGSPITVLPVDPVNKLFYDPISDESFLRNIAEDRYDSNDGFYYRYTCKENSTGYVCPGTSWEFNANMESNKFREKERTDGGDWDFLYETGTCLFILPAAECTDLALPFSAGHGCW